MFNFLRKKESDNTKKYAFYNRNTLELVVLLYNRLVTGMILSQAIENLSKGFYSDETVSFLREAFEINNEDELCSFKKRVKILGGIHDKSHDLVSVIYNIKMNNMDQLQSLDALALLIEDIRDRIRPT